MKNSKEDQVTSEFDVRWKEKARTSESSAHAVMQVFRELSVAGIDHHSIGVLIEQVYLVVSEFSREIKLQDVDRVRVEMNLPIGIPLKTILFALRAVGVVGIDPHIEQSPDSEETKVVHIYLEPASYMTTANELHMTSVKGHFVNS